MLVQEFATQRELTPPTQTLLKRCLQAFDFFRRAGFSADDIFLSFDKADNVGITLNPQDNSGKEVAVLCGKADVGHEKFQATWLEFAEKLRTFDPVDLLIWTTSEGMLNHETLAASMRKNGYAVHVNPDNLPADPWTAAREAFKARVPGPEWKDPRGLETPYRVIVACCGAACLTDAEYVAQLEAPDSLWCCPVHGKAGKWDDDWLEARSELA